MGRSLLLVLFVLTACAPGAVAQPIDIHARPESSALAEHTPPPPAGDARFEGMRRLISEHHVRSLDDLLPLLPNELRERHVLVYESRSTQGATYRAPRVILYAPDATLMMAYGGDPALSGYLALETAVFDERARLFHFREITFAGDRTAPPVVSEADPPRCLACHGGDRPQPIWDTYPSWPGVYGQDEHRRSPDDEDGFRAFAASRLSNPRYRSLLALEPALTPALRPDVAAYEGRDALSENARFGILLQALSYRGIARDVVAAHRFWAFRYALLASLDPQCVDVEAFVPDAVRAGFGRTPRDFEAETESANATQAYWKRLRAQTVRDGPSLAPSEALTPFRYLVEEGLGLSTKGWTLALEKGTYDFSSPRRLTKILERAIFAAIARSDPDAPLSHARADARDGYCAILRKRSLAALGASLARGRAGGAGGTLSSSYGVPWLQSNVTQSDESK